MMLGMTTHQQVWQMLLTHKYLCLKKATDGMVWHVYNNSYDALLSDNIAECNFMYACRYSVTFLLSARRCIV